MFILRWFLIPLAVVVAGAIGAGQMDFFQSLRPTDLGVRSGKLKLSSGTDNSVSSQTAQYPEHPQHLAAQIAPLPLRGDGPSTLARIKSIVKVMAGAKIVKSEADYLYTHHTTPLMKFVDDVEFWYDPVTQVILVRSASRIWESDLGLNRKRTEAVRAALASSI